MNLQLIKDGTPFDSVLDKGSSKVDYAKVDTIPLDEACSGLEGRYVSYYSRVYKIYKCHKRPVDPVQFSRKVMKKPTELSSEQWLSLATWSSTETLADEEGFYLLETPVCPFKYLLNALLPRA